MACIRLQLVYLDRHNLEIYIREHVLPRDGAFIESADIPAHVDMAGLILFLNKRLCEREAYRARIRKVTERRAVINAVHVEWGEGHISRLVGGDTIVQDNELRMQPTESLHLPRQLDDSWLATLPSTAVENIIRHADEVSVLQVASPTVAAQYISTPIRKMLVDVAWSD